MPANRKPTALKLLRGNPGKRPLPENEPTFTGPAPSPPAYLTMRAKKLWRELILELGDIGLVTGPDRYTFATYCQATARAIEAEEILSRQGQSIEEEIVTRQGNLTGKVKIRAHPMVSAALKWHALASAMAARFGLNPADRSRVSLPEKEDVNEEESDGDLL
jgi:P27 family predicted phage terminase small subunit